MKVGSIITANSKGQIVIPKKMRNTLGIHQGVRLGLQVAAGGVFIYPLGDFVAKVEAESSYVKLLEKTKGTWAEENWDKLRQKRAKVELEASRSRKKAW